MKADFQVVGALPDQAWLDDVVAFAERLKALPWGGDGYDRLVIGDINASLREWMQPAEYEEWQAGHAGGRIGATGAKAFIAHDGLRTAAVLPLPEQFSFLMFACHELGCLVGDEADVFVVDLHIAARSVALASSAASVQASYAPVSPPLI